MRTLFFSIALILLAVPSFGQSDFEIDYQKAERAVKDYIEGTASGNISQIRRAFHEDAELYSISEGDLRVIPIDKYVGFFKAGKANSRKGRIVALDVVNDAANAVVEVDMGDRRYTDYILLLKVQDQWKIIKKSYTYEPYGMKGKVLFVVSSEDHYRNSDYRTGAHFGEIVKPYHIFTNAGYEVDFVSPEGGEVPVAYVNLQDVLQKKYFYDLKFNRKLKHSQKAQEVKAGDYQAVYYAGGAAAMFDLPEDEEIAELARTIYEEQQGIIGAVCHGPAGLVNLKLKDGSYLVEGKKVNSFTDEEESYSSKKELLPFLLESKLRERGALFEQSEAGEAHVAVSGRLVTGQNPASCEQLSEAMLKLLEQAQAVSKGL